MWAEKKRKRPHEWLEGVLGVLGLAPTTYISQIIKKVLKGYYAETCNIFKFIIWNQNMLKMKF